LFREKPFSLFILLGWSLVSIVSIASMIVFGFVVGDAGVLDLDVMFQVDVPCHD
jgi:hypothetical protein